MTAPMRYRLILFCGLLPALAFAADEPNTLTEPERAAGWRLLWDGRSAEGWRTARSDTFPTRGWAMTNGVLTVLANGGGGDIITKERFRQFELALEFNITEGANSGVKYFVQTDASPNNPATGRSTGLGTVIGLEYQILDDVRHPDARGGRDGNRKLGSLYDLFPTITNKPAAPIGEWNAARIVVTDKHVEHWLNGVKVLEYDRGSDAYRQAVATSKYNVVPAFGEWADGHILLQDHGNHVSYRNLKIRVPAAK